MDTKRMDTNPTRLVYLDILKVVALVFMACIHAFNISAVLEMLTERFPTKAVSTQLGILYLFTPGVFMFCMGCGQVMTRKSSPAELARRGVHLLLVGLILNIIRAVIPYILMGLFINPEFFWEVPYWLLGSDILYFAGLYFLLFALFKRLCLTDWEILAIAGAMLLVSHFIQPPACQNETIEELLGNFIYVDGNSYFPILSWSIFPASGYVYQKLYDRNENKNRFVGSIGIISAVVFLLTLAVLYFVGGIQTRYFLWGEMEFRMDLPAFLITMSITGMYISVAFFLSKLIKAEKVKALFCLVSSNINRIYCIHWVLLIYGILVWTMLAETGTSSALIIYLIGTAAFLLSAALAAFYMTHKKGKVKGLTPNRRKFLN